MQKPYELIDMQSSGDGAVATAFANQVAYCEANAAPITARVVAAVGRLLAQVEALNAADFVEAALAEPQAAGVTRVVLHSVVWQYIPADQQARVEAALEKAAAQATPDRPLAHVSVEANRTVHRHEVRARYWPGGAEDRLLALSHAHGAAYRWVAGDEGGAAAASSSSSS